MDDVFEKIIRELFPQTHLPFWKRGLMKWAFGNKILSNIMHNDKLQNKNGITWIDSVLNFLQLSCETPGTDLSNIPRQGPVLAISNHPTVMDGLALIHTIAKVRKDIKIVSNHVLPIIFPQVTELTIGIKNMAGKMSHKKFKEMNDHLKNGGVLIICPAGKLASWSPSGLKEHVWNPGFIQLALRNKVALVPFHITGKNSKKYYFTATLWRQLSNLMIIRESMRHRGNKMQVRVGPQIGLDIVNLDDRDPVLIANECLSRLENISRNDPVNININSDTTHPITKNALITALNACETLREFSDGKKVLVYRYNNEKCTPIINELGRLRESCYRAIGTGTGEDRDNDIFDRSYYHIILWDPSGLEIQGAYRMMPVAEQLARQGAEGLYSNTLFKYNDAAWDYLDECMEIGRGFIQKQFQRTNALDCLWKGIFDFIKFYPQCKYLLGVLTIPGAYPVEVQKLIVAFYTIYFSAENSICSAIDSFTVEDRHVYDIFSGQCFKEDWAVLNTLLSEKGCQLPWPYKQAARWFTPGGSSFITFTKDSSFNSVAGLNVSAITELNKTYCRHYLGSNFTNIQYNI